jgi:hypothetical protein
LRLVLAIACRTVAQQLLRSVLAENARLDRAALCILLVQDELVVHLRTHNKNERVMVSDCLLPDNTLARRAHRKSGPFLL